MTRVTARESARGRSGSLNWRARLTSPARHLQEALDAEVAARPPLLVVDLSKLTFLDSWALHSILAASSELRAAGGSLALSSPTGEVRRVWN